MKGKNKNMSVCSLFEDVNYITVYNQRTGVEVGRIFNENYGTRKKPSYIALVIASGKKGKVKSIEHGEAFILNSSRFSCLAEIIQEVKNVICWQLWKKNERQRALVGTYKTEEEANEERTFRESRFDKHLFWEVIPIYENKKQTYLFQ